MSFLDELYYGNINPNENRNRKPLPYEKAVRTFSDIENKLSKELNGGNLKLFNELVNASDEISATSGVENFKMKKSIISIISIHKRSLVKRYSIG
mgnify:CR=1 FL=1